MFQFRMQNMPAFNDNDDPRASREFRVPWLTLLIIGAWAGGAWLVVRMVG